MSLKIACFFLSVCALFTACSKSGNLDNPVNTNPPPDFLLRTTYSAGYDASGNSTYKIGQDYNYDKPNNMVTVYEKDTFGTSISLDTIVCKLNNDSITINHHLAKPFKETYYLNKSHSQIDSLHIINSNQLLIYTYSYTVNGDEKLFMNKSTGIFYTNGVADNPLVQTTNYTWNNGNLTKYMNSFETVNYTYNQNVLAAQPDALLIVYNPVVYLNQNKNVIETFSYSFSSNSNIENFQSHYDENGRVVSSKGINTNGSTYFISYTYY